MDMGRSNGTERHTATVSVGWTWEEAT
ncbi:hypothetical protein AVEN_110190-1, partial [Araneus ventricosus]